MSQHRTQYVGNFVCPCDDADIPPTVLGTVEIVAPLLQFLTSFISQRARYSGAELYSLLCCLKLRLPQR